MRKNKFKLTANWAFCACLPVLVLLTACAGFAPYVKPDMPVHLQMESTDLRSVPSDLIDADLVPQLESQHSVPWWLGFADEKLAGWVTQAAVANLDLRISGAKVDQSWALLSSASAKRWPELSAKANALRQKNLGTSAASPLSTSGSVDLSAIWDIDLTGAKAHEQESRQANWQSGLAEQAYSRGNVQAEVVQSYIDLRLNCARLRIQQALLASLARSETYAQQRVRAGLMASSDAIAYTLRYQAQRTVLADTLASQSIQLHALALLTAQSLGHIQAVAELCDTPTSIPIFKQSVPASIPVRVLRQRSDVMAAEHRIAQAYADVGIARAELYPKLSLSGSIGRSYSAASGQSSQGGIWSFGPSLSIPLLDWGRLQAQVQLKNAALTEARLMYEKTILTALRELQDAISSLVQHNVRLPIMREAWQQRQAVERVMLRKQQAGLSQVLDFEESLRLRLTAEDEWLTAQASTAQAWVQVFKATGGVW
jgi:outer membrane protein, multidrug efflux system